MLQLNLKLAQQKLIETDSDGKYVQYETQVTYQQYEHCTQRQNRDN